MVSQNPVATAPGLSSAPLQNGAPSMQTSQQDTHTDLTVEAQAFPLPRSSSSPLAIPGAESSTDLPHQPQQTNPLHPSSSSQTSFSSSVNSFRVQPFAQPYFRLTDQEHEALRKRLHQCRTYIFSDFRLLQELEGLGRGWTAFSRAREQAKRDGSLATFQRQVKAEMEETARLGLAYPKGPGTKQKFDDEGLPLPPGAISLQAAEDASKQDVKQSTKRKRPRMTELEQLMLNQDEADGESSDWDEPKPSYVYPGRGRPRGAKNKQYLAPINQPDKSSRPQRNLKRPDYTMRGKYDIAESSASSPTKSNLSSSPISGKTYEIIKPVFIDFPCLWKGCNAVLINLGTLKKHLHVVHSAAAREHLRCQWDKCGQLETPVIFSKLSDVDSHVMDIHMNEVAWKLGDGIGSVRVAGGPVVPDTSVNPPLRLFRKEYPVKQVPKTKKKVDDDSSDTDSSEDSDDEDILP